jgi:DNA-binding HxlR family transcriptional regulator
MVMRFETRLQDRSGWSTERCSIGKALELLRTKTSFLVVRECLYGTTRFEDFVDRVGASAPAVSRALKQLEAAGVVSKTPYREAGQRGRAEYTLTRMGEDLFPALLALLQWGDAYLQPQGRPLVFVEQGSGQELQVRVTTEPEPAVRPEDVEVRTPLI